LNGAAGDHRTTVRGGSFGAIHGFALPIASGIWHNWNADDGGAFLMDTYRQRFIDYLRQRIDEMKAHLEFFNGDGIELCQRRGAGSSRVDIKPAAIKHLEYSLAEAERQIAEAERGIESDQACCHSSP
jgi:hypothetical protein